MIGKDSEGITSLHAANTFWAWVLRVISWIRNPSCYSDENKRTIACVKKYLIDEMGQDRLSRICARYNLDLDRMEKKGNPLLSRDLAKIITGVHDVKMQDLEDIIQAAKKSEDAWPFYISKDLREPLSKAATSEELDAATFARLVQELSQETTGVSNLATVPELKGEMWGGAPSESMAGFISDPFLADRERMALSKENPTDSYETFVHNFVVKTVAREPRLGMLVPAPNHADGTARFYRVGAKIISGGGMVSFVLTPATKDSDLKPIRFYRGTATSPSSIDMSSTLATDMEVDLGRGAYESGKIYNQLLREKLGPIPLVSGHSLGSTTAQYALVDDNDAEEAYLHNGPGIPAEEAERFNQRMRDTGKEITLRVTDAHTDFCSSLGKKHLGFDSPDNVNIIYRKLYPKVEYKTRLLKYKITDEVRGVEEAQEMVFAAVKKMAPSFAHVHVAERESRIYGMEGGHTREQVNALLDRENVEGSKEVLRTKLGPIIGRIILFFRNVFRKIFGSRTQREMGIHIGRFESGKWVEKHYTREETLAFNEQAEK